MKNPLRGLAVLASLFFCAPALAQQAVPALPVLGVITSPAELPDADGDGIITVQRLGATLTPPQARGTDLVRCPALPGFAYVLRGAVCPQAPRPVMTIDGHEKDGAASLTRLAAITATSDVRVTGLPLRLVKTDWGTRYQGLVIDGLSGSTFRSGIELTSRAVDYVQDVTIRNVQISGRPGKPNTSPNLPECITLKSGRNIRLERIRCAWFQMTAKVGGAASYSYPQNGDGIDVEYGVGPVYLDDFRVEHVSDSGFDFLKGHDITGGPGGLWVRDAARCMKSGAPRVQVALLDCGNTRATGVEVKGNATTIDLFRYDFTGMTWPVVMFTTEKGGAGSGHLTIGRCEWTGTPPKGTTLSRKGSGTTLTLGEGCRLP